MLPLAIFLPACFALNLSFGPNNLLALTHGATRGPRFAMLAGLARLAAFVPVIAASAAGLSLLLAASATAFTIAKTAGALYLIWIGWRLLRARGTAEAAPGPESLPAAARREALVALGNPKAILIFAAFFPQFVDPDSYWQSYALVGGLFLALEFAALTLYALLGFVAGGAAGRGLRRLTQISGLAMVGFGLALLFARRPASA